MHGRRETLPQCIQLCPAVVIAEQFTQGTPEHPVVGFGGLGLVEEAEVFPSTGPGLEARVEQFAETEGAVVEGVTAGSAVVAVEVALAVAHPHPLGHQAREPPPEQPRQFHHLSFERQGSIDLIPVVAINQVLNDQHQFLHGAGMSLGPHPSREQFDLAHPQK